MPKNKKRSAAHRGGSGGSGGSGAAAATVATTGEGIPATGTGLPAGVAGPPRWRAGSCSSPPADVCASGAWGATADYNSRRAPHPSSRESNLAAGRARAPAAGRGRVGAGVESVAIGVPGRWAGKGLSAEAAASCPGLSLAQGGAELESRPRCHPSPVTPGSIMEFLEAQTSGRFGLAPASRGLGFARKDRGDAESRSGFVPPPACALLVSTSSVLGRWRRWGWPPPHLVLRRTPDRHQRKPRSPTAPSPRRPPAARGRKCSLLCAAFCRSAVSPG